MGADHKKFIKAMRWEKRVQRTGWVWKSDGEKDKRIREREKHRQRNSKRRPIGADRLIKDTDTD